MVNLQSACSKLKYLPSKQKCAVRSYSVATESVVTVITTRPIITSQEGRAGDTVKGSPFDGTSYCKASF